MKTVKSLVVAVSLCAAFSFSAFGATSQEQAGQQGQTVRLAYYGHHYYYHRNYYHRDAYRYHYKKCWHDRYNRVYCRWYRY